MKKSNRLHQTLSCRNIFIICSRHTPPRTILGVGGVTFVRSVCMLSAFPSVLFPFASKAYICTRHRTLCLLFGHSNSKPPTYSKHFNGEYAPVLKMGTHFSGRCAPLSILGTHFNGDHNLWQRHGPYFPKSFWYKTSSRFIIPEYGLSFL